MNYNIELILFEFLIDFYKNHKIFGNIIINIILFFTIKFAKKNSNKVIYLISTMNKL